MAAFWFLVALVGQVASLLMIEAGPLLRYQHYPPLATLVSTHTWLLALVAVQTVLVVAGWVGLARRRPAAQRGRPYVRIAAALALSLCTAATVSPSVSRYLAELGFAACLQVLSIATVVLMVLALNDSSLPRAERVLNRVFGSGDETADGAARGDRFGWIAAATATAIAATLTVLIYERQPHVPDEVAYLHHARYLAAGLLTMPAPPVPAAFDVDLLQYEPTRWFSPVPIGWPAMLALGVAAGVPWLVNPILGGVNVLLAYALLGDLYPRRVARYATVLLALSPWFLFLAMSYMTHMFTLTCALVAAVSVMRARRNPTVRWGVLAGAGVGATSLIRPLDGVVVGALIALWSIGVGGSRLKLPSLAGLAIGTLVIGALVFPYNRALTGDPLKFPINVYVDQRYPKNANAYGFGPDRGMGWALDPHPGHGPVDGLINANLNTFGLNTDLFGWTTGSLVFLAWLLCSMQLDRSDRLMLSAIAAVVVAYFFYYFSGGPDFGARYWFPIVVPLVALSARGIRAMERVAGARVGIAVAALIVMALTTFVPWRAVDKYRNFRGMRADIGTLASTFGFDGDLVLVRGQRHPDYASAFVRNPIDLSSRATIYAWDRNAEVRTAALRAYADRRVWFVDGPSVTKAGYRLARGPVPACELLAEPLQ